MASAFRMMGTALGTWGAISMQIRTVRQAETVTKPGTYTAGNGLYLIVGPNSKSWIYRYQFKGRRRDMGLGSARLVTLADARHLAHEAERRAKIERIDPIEHRREIESAAAAAKETRLVTFKQAMDETYKNKKPGWSIGHAANWESSLLKHVIPRIGKMPVTQIKADAIVSGILKPMWEKHPKLAEDLQVRIEAIFKTAIANDWCTGEILVKIKHLMSLLPKRVSKSHDALDRRDLPAFMAELRSLNTVASRTIELLILCGLRLNEVRPAQWDEINMEERLWTVPAERVKGRMGQRVPHDVPLSTAAMTVLNRMASIRQSVFVFAGGASGAISESTMTRELKKLRPDVTLHGFRTTFSTWLNNQGFPDQMVEHALAHAVGTKVKRIYDQQTMIEKRREMMEVWADYCAGVEPASNVVPLRAL